jgi:hypothetical protein
MQQSASIPEADLVPNQRRDVISTGSRRCPTCLPWFLALTTLGDSSMLTSNCTNTLLRMHIHTRLGQLEYCGCERTRFCGMWTMFSSRKRFELVRDAMHPGVLPTIPLDDISCPTSLTPVLMRHLENQGLVDLATSYA